MTAPLLEIEQHKLKYATFIESPNFDDYPQDCDLSLIVLHNISLPPRQYGGNGVVELFTNKLDPNEHEYYQGIHQLKVSSHLFIRRDGGVIQFVPFNKRAWHAGLSNFKGREKCNDFSIGIELEGCDQEAFESIQYDVLKTVIASLQANYPTLTTGDIVGHSEISPGRKTDPGPFFNWQGIR